MDERKTEALTSYRTVRPAIYLESVTLVFMFPALSEIARA